jgi:hemoglobin
VVQQRQTLLRALAEANGAWRVCVLMASIYDQIGGRPAVAAAVDDLYARILSDRELAHYFTGIDMARQKAHLRAFVAAALGGPQHYAGRDMHTAHAALGISSAAFDGVVAHLAGALAGLGVPAAQIDAIAGTLAPLRAQIVAA